MSGEFGDGYSDYEDSGDSGDFGEDVLLQVGPYPGTDADEEFVLDQESLYLNDDVTGGLRAWSATIERRRVVRERADQLEHEAADAWADGEMAAYEAWADDRDLEDSAGFGGDVRWGMFPH